MKLFCRLLPNLKLFFRDKRIRDLRSPTPFYLTTKLFDLRAHSLLLNIKVLRRSCTRNTQNKSRNNQTGAEPVPLLGSRELTTTKIPKIVTKPKY